MAVFFSLLTLLDLQYKPTPIPTTTIPSNILINKNRTIPRIILVIRQQIIGDGPEEEDDGDVVDDGEELLLIVSFKIPSTRSQKSVHSFSSEAVTIGSPDP